MRRRLVGRLIIGIVMRVGIYRVVLRIIVCWVERIMLLVFFVVTVRVVDVLYRVLQSQNQRNFQNSFSQQLTVG